MTPSLDESAPFDLANTFPSGLCCRARCHFWSRRQIAHDPGKRKRLAEWLRPPTGDLTDLVDALDRVHLGAKLTSDGPIQTQEKKCQHVEKSHDLPAFQSPKTRFRSRSVSLPTRRDGFKGRSMGVASCRDSQRNSSKVAPISNRATSFHALIGAVLLRWNGSGENEPRNR